jgi:hypothetical protein
MRSTSCGGVSTEGSERDLGLVCKGLGFVEDDNLRRGITEIAFGTL